MSLLRRALALALVASPALWVAGPATASKATPSPAQTPRGAVYVLTNQTAGNAVIQYRRAPDGRLTLVGSHPTGGTGTAAGLGSQGAVVIDQTGRYLFAANAGSNSVTSFGIDNDGGLHQISTVPSGGLMPTSITVRGDLAYVLNAGGDGNISGFTVRSGALSPLAGAILPLSGVGTSPAQVAFAPGGSQLLVTERATSRLDLYAVGANGVASGPAVISAAGTTPFGFQFDGKGHVVVSEAFGGAADASAVSSYAVNSGSLAVLSASVPTTETAACWIAITTNGRFAYAGNTGGASITGYNIRRDGTLQILDADGKTATAAAGVTDLAVTGNFLYARLSNGTVGAYVIDANNGDLASIGAFAGLPAGAAGIAVR